MGEGVTTLGMRTNFDALTRHVQTGAAYSLTEAEGGAASCCACGGSSVMGQPARTSSASAVKSRPSAGTAS